MNLKPRGFKANPGLELANAFSVKSKLHQYRISLPFVLCALCG
jgi:hypothetical protein